MTSGVYAITNTVNGHRYIGSSSDIEVRWKNHLAMLRTNHHHSPHLQHAWQKYGEGAFEFSILIICDPDDLIDNEQSFIDSALPEYNISPTAGRVAGIQRSDEYRRKQSISQSGKEIPIETRRKISAGMRGIKNSLGTHRIVSEETRRKISQALLGHTVSEKTRRKISDKSKGYHHTDAARQKISKSLIGNTRAAK